MRLLAPVLVGACFVATGATADFHPGVPLFSEALIITAQADLEAVALEVADQPNATGSIIDVNEAEFAFPNWIVLQDHEGEDFMLLSRSHVESVGSGLSETLGILVDDEGVPLYSQLAQVDAEPQATGGISTIIDLEMAVAGYEDR